jgi:membrane fusion protein (multidrug efflux system)
MRDNELNLVRRTQMPRTGGTPNLFNLIILGGLMAASLLVSACAGQASAASAPKPALGIPVAAEAARRGDIQQALSYSGEIRAKAQVTVFPKGSGRVERLLVDVGSPVKAGETLAELERDSAALQVVQARAGLAAAEAQRAQLLAGARPEELAAAEAGVAMQRIRLEQMRRGGRAEDVAVARATLEAQRARLALLEQGGRAEAVGQAEAALAAARAKLALVERGAAADVRQAARSAVAADRAGLAAAEAALAGVGGTSAAEQQAAQSQVQTLGAQVEAAEAALRHVQTVEGAAIAQRDAARVGLAERFAPTEAEVRAAEAAVESARASVGQAQASRAATYGEGQNTACYESGALGIERIEGACANARLAADAAIGAAEKGLAVAEARLRYVREGGTPAQQAQVVAAAAQAEASLKQVQTQRANLESALVQAREGLKTAQARLAAQDGAQAAARQAAAAQVAAARERLQTSQARLEQVEAGAEPEEVVQAEAAVRQAEQALLLASSPATEPEVRAQRAQVAQAAAQLRKAEQPFTADDLQQQEQALAQAEAQLRMRQNGATEHESRAAEAAVEQARAQLDLVMLGSKETTVTAPVDGVVGERMIAQGALVSPSTPLLTVVPPALELMVNVEESQIGQVKEGQNVSLQVAGYPGEQFNGRVTVIAPIVDARSRTLSVRVEPTDGTDKLRPGMFAKLSIVTAARQGALLAPREAVVVGPSGKDGTVALIDAENRVRKLAVKLGLTSDRYAEVVGDLREGQLLATSGVSDLRDGDIVSPQVDNPTASAQ